MIDENIDISIKYNPFDANYTKIRYHTHGYAADIMRYNIMIDKQIFYCERAV